MRFSRAQSIVDHRDFEAIMWLCWRCWFVAVLLVLPELSHAQRKPLSLGDRVQLAELASRDSLYGFYRAGRSIEGRLQCVHDDTVFVDATPVVASRIHVLRVVDGAEQRPSYAVAGTMVGAALGALVAQTNQLDAPMAPPRSRKVGSSAVWAGAAIGLFVGIGLGGKSHDRWVSTDINALRVLRNSGC